MEKMLQRRNCAFRADGKAADEQGGGSSCSEISSEDKVYIAIIAGLCALVLAACATWVLLKKHLSTRASRRAAQLPASLEPEMGQMSTHGRAPLLLSTPSPSEPPYSPYADSLSSRSHSSSHSHGSAYGTPSAESHASYSFPILSADGHLLPPAPASARMYVGQGDGERPLPEPPLPTSGLSPQYDNEHDNEYEYEGKPEYGYQYQSLGYEPEEQYPSPHAQMHQQQQPEPRLVGLWPESLSRKPGQGLGPSRPVSIISTPTLSPGLEFGQVQPHTATVHRSFSSEGQEYDLGVRY